MSARRKFDWDEAVRLRAEGLSYAAVAERLGVTTMSVYRAVNPEKRAAAAVWRAAWNHEGVCPDCGAATTRRSGGRSRRCWSCASSRPHRAAAERDRLAADLARVTAERDALHADFRRCHELIWLAEKHIPRDALTAYYAEKNAADPPQNTQGAEVQFGGTP